MGTGYTRNDTGNNIADGNVINASDLDGEFDAVQAAFNESTGHTHDGTSAEGAPVTTVGPAQDVNVGTGAVTPKTDNTIDLGSGSLEFKDLYIDGTANIDSLVADTADINAGTIDATVIGGSTPAAATVTTLTVNGNTTLGDAATDTVTFTADVASNIIPSADNTHDLGASGSEWKDLYIDGTANIDSLVADTADINGGTIDGVTIGGAAPGVGTFTTANATTVDATNIEVTNIKAKDGSASATIADSTGVMTIASSVLTTADINGGTIDNATIATSNITVGAGKTLDVSAGTLTLANDQISGDKVQGGTIGSTTITTLTSTTGNITTVNATTVDTTNLEVTALKAKDGTSAGSIADSTGVVTIASSVLTTTDINGGTIDGVTIGGASAGAGTFTTLTATGNVTLGDAATDTVTVTADVASDLTPSVDGSFNLGASGAEWQDLFIDGTANIDSLVADTADIDGGTIDGTTIGGASAAVGTFTQVNVDNLRLDGNAITSTNTNGNIALTPNGVGEVDISKVDIDSGTIDGTAIGGSTAAAGSFTTLNTSGQVVFNDAGADVDFRVEGDTNANLLFVDAGNDRVGIGTNAPLDRLTINEPDTVGTDRVVFRATTASGGALYFLANDLSLAAPTWAIGTGNSEPLAFNVGGTERMRISPSGEVLVGGTTEVAVAGGGPGNLTIQRARTGTYQPTLNIFADDTSIGSGDVLGLIKWFGNDTTSNTPTNLAYVAAVASGTHAAGDNPTDLVFGCTNDGSETVAEFARLAQDGASGREFEIKQATLANSAASYFKASGGTAGTLNRAAQVGVYKHSGITNSAGFLSVATEDGIDNYIWADNSDILRISTTIANIGTTGGTVVGTQTSDERLKDISGPLSYGLNEVLAIEPIAFTMKDDPSIPKIGFSAQQVQPIVPEAVYDTKECIDGYTENEETKEQIANSDRTKLAMEYTQLIPVLVKAIQELKAELDEAKARIAALENA